MACRHWPDLSLAMTTCEVPWNAPPRQRAGRVRNNLPLLQITVLYVEGPGMLQGGVLQRTRGLASPMLD